MDKDQSIDKLLRRTSRGSGQPQLEQACLDAATLAALSDGTLTPRERDAAEAHAADCDRCLAVLAAIARTAPPPAAKQRPAWWSVRWLVPLTTAAVGIIAWVVVLDAPIPTRPAPPAPAAASEAPRAEPQVQDKREPPPQARTDALQKKSEAAKGAALSRRGAPADSAGNRKQAAEAVQAPAPVPTFRDEAKGQLAAAASQAKRLDAAITSPDPNARWRIVGRSVERSNDGGRTWQRQQLDAPDDLLAGAAPAPAICWLVGRKGLVFLSTDGQTWRRLPFPQATADLIAVTARDGLTATVTASDGRSYHTTNAGATWTLQENPATPF